NVKAAPHARSICSASRRAFRSPFTRRLCVIASASAGSDRAGAYCSTMLEPEDHLAARLARDGDPEQIHFEESAPPLPSAGKGYRAKPVRQQTVWLGIISPIFHSSPCSMK